MKKVTLTEKLNKTLGSLKELLSVDTLGGINVNVGASKSVKISHFIQKFRNKGKIENRKVLWF